MHDDLNLTNYILTAPISVTIKKTEKILSQLKKSIFKIKYNDKTSTGFFCKIKHGNSPINALVVNYQIIDENFKINNKVLEISMDDNIEEKEKNKKKENIKINLDPNRNIYFLKNSDITIIEMKEEDGLDNYIFLELDDNLLKEDSEIFYKDDSIYILQYKIEEEASVSYGLFVDGDRNEIFIYSDIGECSLGAPILNLLTNKVIGICKGYTRDQPNKKGINFKYIIEEFKQVNKFDDKVPINVKKNEIRVSLKIDKDISQKVYFMYNSSKNSRDEENISMNSILFIHIFQNSKIF